MFAFRILVAVSLAALALLPSRAWAQAAPTSLLANKTPVAARGVAGAERLTDGRLAPEGDFWLTTQTARLRDKDAYAIFDLGGVQPIRCAFLQGDDNDTYDVSGSVNGDNFFPMFVAPPVGRSGLRLRTLKLVATARFIRLQARGGDGAYAVSELGIFDACPETWPPEFTRVQGAPVAQSFESKLTWFTLTGLAFILMFLGRARLWLTLAAACIPFALAGAMVPDVVRLFPLVDHEPLIRASVAALAGALAAREFLLGKLDRVGARVAAAVLALLSMLALGCYYHFGAPQGWHAKEARRTYVHTHDLRHYFPLAKYFPELGFDGLYAASFLAQLEIRNLPFEELDGQTFRDLRVSAIKPAGEMKPHIEEVRKRFSAERWASFKRDIRTFVDIMGPQPFLDNMHDHGGNATPVWLLAASAIVHDLAATERNLALLGLFDVALLALLFFVVGRVFGWKVMGYVIVVFGATDFYMFGSNLAGSLLRQDWLVALGLGACAMRRNRGVLAGLLFAYAALIRAFPAVATAFITVPALWWLVDHLREHKRLPRWSAFRQHDRLTLRAIGGAAACVFGFVTLTLLLFGASAWSQWLQKISIHVGDVGVNNVGLTNLLGFDPSSTVQKLAAAGHAHPWAAWEESFRETLGRRRPLGYIVAAAQVLLALFACRGRRPESAALLGLTTLPFLTAVSNYYMHLIFLLPLAVPAQDTPRRFGQWLVLLSALCLGQWATYSWARGWIDVFFTYQSALLLVTFVLLLVPLARDAYTHRERAQVSSGIHPAER